MTNFEQAPPPASDKGHDLVKPGKEAGDAQNLSHQCNPTPGKPMEIPKSGGGTEAQAKANQTFGECSIIGDNGKDLTGSKSESAASGGKNGDNNDLGSAAASVEANPPNSATNNGDGGGGGSSGGGNRGDGGGGSGSAGKEGDHNNPGSGNASVEGKPDKPDAKEPGSFKKLIANTIRAVPVALNLLGNPGDTAPPPQPARIEQTENGTTCNFANPESSGGRVTAGDASMSSTGGSSDYAGTPPTGGPSDYAGSHSASGLNDYAGAPPTGGPSDYAGPHSASGLNDYAGAPTAGGLSEYAGRPTGGGSSDYAGSHSAGVPSDHATPPSADAAGSIGHPITPIDGGSGSGTVNGHFANIDFGGSGAGAGADPFVASGPGTSAGADSLVASGPGTGANPFAGSGSGIGGGAENGYGGNISPDYSAGGQPNGEGSREAELPEPDEEGNKGPKPKGSLADGDKNHTMNIKEPPAYPALSGLSQTGLNQYKYALPHVQIVNGDTPSQF